MKIAISATSQEKDAAMDPRFGRAMAFVLVDTETGTKETLLNPAINESGGAGIRASEYLLDQGVEAVISGSFGPNAYRVLDAAGISMYQAAGGAIDDLIASFAAGEIPLSSSPRSIGRRHQGRQ